MTKEDMVVSCVGAIIGLTAVFSGGNAEALKEETVENKTEVAEAKTPKAIKEKYYNATTLSDKELKELKNRLDRGERIFAKVEYLNLGSQGRLRVPSFKGLRTDINTQQTHV